MWGVCGWVGGVCVVPCIVVGGSVGGGSTSPSSHTETHKHTNTPSQDRRYNLGPRFLVSIDLREAQVRA